MAKTYLVNDIQIVPPDPSKGTDKVVFEITAKDGRTKDKVFRISFADTKHAVSSLLPPLARLVEDSPLSFLPPRDCEEQQV